MSNNSFTLLTTLYEEANRFRREEYKMCLRKNIENPDFSKVIVFFEGYENSKFLNELLSFDLENKVSVVFIKTRPFFSNLFEYARKKLSDKIVIANADIFFDESLNLLTEEYLKNTLVSLTRWDISADGSVALHTEEFNDSADAWVFLASLNPFYGDIMMGYPGCEKITLFAFEAGLSINNPSKSVKAYHYHLSGVKNYTLDHQYPPPYIFLLPAKIDEKSDIRIWRGP